MVDFRDEAESHPRGAGRREDSMNGMTTPDPIHPGGRSRATRSPGNKEWIDDVATAFGVLFFVVFSIWVVINLIGWLFPFGSPTTLLDVLKAEWKWVRNLRVY